MKHAEHYRLVVSGLGGTPYISKISSGNKNLMLSDRREVPAHEMFKAIEEFAKGQIDEGCNVLQVKTESGRLVYEIKFPVKELIEKKALIRNYAEKALATYAIVNKAENSPCTLTMEVAQQLANYILELTN